LNNNITLQSMEDAVKAEDLKTYVKPTAADFYCTILTLFALVSL